MQLRNARGVAVHTNPVGERADPRPPAKAPSTSEVRGALPGAPVRFSYGSCSGNRGARHAPPAYDERLDLPQQAHQQLNRKSRLSAGHGPGRAETVTAESYQEKLAFAVAAAVLGVTAEPYDRDGRQRAVDAILHYADGRKAAMEVSATGPDRETPIQHYLGQRGHSQTMPSVTGTWVVQLPRTFHPADTRKVEEELHQREERGVRPLSELTAADVDLGELAGRGMRADLIRTTGSRVHFVLSPTARPHRLGPGGLPHELDTLLGEERMQSKLSKLAASGFAERHLFLLVLPGTFKQPVFDALAFGGPLPETAPHLPGGLSQVWLLTGVRAGGVVRAVAGQGWRRDAPYNAIDVSALR